MQKTTDQMQLTVQDNGKGFNLKDRQTGGWAVRYARMSGGIIR